MPSLGIPEPHGKLESQEYFKELSRRFVLQEEFLGIDKPVNRVSPLVSVWVITYQHESYIRQCLDSILSQKVNFPYEIVIGEDHSTDGTREICVDYAKRYPDRVRLFLRDRNLSHTVIDGTPYWFNGRWTHQSCRGKYIALCEGDDFWINPRKLQMQVEMMENDQGIGLVHGEAHAYHQSSNLWHHYSHRRRCDLNICDDLFLSLLDGRYRIITCTAMYRKALFEIIAKHDSYKMSQQQCRIVGDIQIWIELSRISRFGYIDEPLGVYRILDESASRSKDNRHILAYGLEGLWIMMHYTKHFNAPHDFRHGHLKRITKSLLVLASQLGESQVVEQLWAIMNDEKVELTFFDRTYRWCSSSSIGRLITPLARRLEVRLERRRV